MRVTVGIEPNETPAVSVTPAHTVDGFEYREHVHVEFGDVSLMGTPADMASALDLALSRVQSIMDTQEGENQ
jgi:hypothetical protein